VKRRTKERTTPDAPNEEWRVADSKSLDYGRGWFLQGGRWETENGSRKFKAPAEGFFDDKEQADRICRILKRAQEANIPDL
jgi:hypothetical protein